MKAMSKLRFSSLLSGWVRWIDPWREHRQVSYVVQFEPPAYIWRYVGHIVEIDHGVVGDFYCAEQQ